VAPPSVRQAHGKAAQTDCFLPELCLSRLFLSDDSAVFPATKGRTAHPCGQADGQPRQKRQRFAGILRITVSTVLHNIQ